MIGAIKVIGDHFAVFVYCQDLCVKCVSVLQFGPNCNGKLQRIQDKNQSSGLGLKQYVLTQVEI